MTQENPFSLLYIITVVKKYFWYITGLIFVALLLAVILTMPFIYKPEFKSSTIIYPTNPERFDIVNLFADEPTVFLYGDSKQVEKLDNIANARELQLTVIDSLDLWPVYGVDKEKDKSPEHYALRMYNGMVRTIKVEGNGLEIEAFDIDPQRAADIVNLVIDLTDKRNKEMISNNRASVLEMYKKSYARLSLQLKAYADSAREIRKKYNIFNVERQTEILLDHILRAESGLAGEQAKLNTFRQHYRGSDTTIINTQARIQGMRTQLQTLVNGKNSPVNLDKFRRGLDEIIVIQELYTTLSSDLKETKEKIDYLSMMFDTDYSSVLITGKALPDDKKARPVRWLILLITLSIATLVSILGTVFIEYLSKKLENTPA